MARIRTIKPELPQSESMGNVSRDARLTFILLWTISDDHGRLRGNSRMLASLLFPYDDDAPKHIDKWLAELDGEGCIARYQVDGSHYIQILNWHSHQRVDKPSDSKIPPFSEDSRIFSKAREDSCLDQRKGSEEGKGSKEGKGVDHGLHARAKPSNYPESFEEFWRLAPKTSCSKSEAYKAYQKSINSGVDHGTIITGVRAYAKYLQDTGTPPAHATTWLNGRRWESEYDEATRQRQFVGGGGGHRPTQQSTKSKWDTEGERLAAKYAAQAEREAGAGTGAV